MRVIITHDFYETFGGAERVTAEIARAFPDAPVYSILGRQSVAERMGVADRIHSLLPARPRLLYHYRKLAPFYQGLVRAATLPDADLVIASSYGYAHGFRTRNNAPVICYSHGPLRHLWSQQDEYATKMPGGALGRLTFDAYAAAYRAVDRSTARGVDLFLTQSPFTAEVIERAYGRHAALLPPFVDCDVFRPSTQPANGYFLFAGRLVEPYKRPSMVIDAFKQLPEVKLRVAGDGPALRDLRRRATSNVEFLGRLGDEDLVNLMQHCHAAVFPSVDDFGLVPLEVNACGRPVIAAQGGGSLHNVAPGVSGEFLEEESSIGIAKAVRNFDVARYDSRAIRAHALRRNGGEFRRGLHQAALRVAASR